VIIFLKVCESDFVSFLTVLKTCARIFTAPCQEKEKSYGFSLA